MGDQHLPLEETGLPFVTVVPDPAFPVRCVGEDLLQRQQAQLPLGVIRPGDATARWARGGLVSGTDTLGVVAGVTEPPRFDLRDRDVHLVDADPASPRVEFGVWCQLGQCTARRPSVLISPSVVLPPFGRDLLLLPPDHRVQPDRGLGERVVGQEPLVGEELQNPT